MRAACCVVHGDFPVGFQRTVLTMLMASRRAESHLYLLQEEIVLFIMCALPVPLSGEL